MTEPHIGQAAQAAQATIARCGRPVSTDAAGAAQLCRRPLEERNAGLACRRHGVLAAADIVQGEPRSPDRGGNPGIGGRRYSAVLGQDIDAAVEELMDAESIGQNEALRRLARDGIAARARRRRRQ